MKNMGLLAAAAILSGCVSTAYGYCSPPTVGVSQSQFQNEQTRFYACLDSEAQLQLQTQIQQQQLDAQRQQIYQQQQQPRPMGADPSIFNQYLRR